MNSRADYLITIIKLTFDLNQEFVYQIIFNKIMNQTSSASLQTVFLKMVLMTVSIPKLQIK